MTEAEWLAGAATRDLSARVLAVVRDRGSERRFRLLACAELRRYSRLDPGTAQALGLAERLADGNATTDEVSAFERRTTRFPQHTAPDPLVTPATEFCANSAHSGDPIQRFPPLLRDIFDNPFRPATFSSEWRTDTAVSLAQQMDESHEFSAMPILAGALQDAGCDRADVLGQCRGTGPHVRGCFVVDLVPGKQ